MEPDRTSRWRVEAPTAWEPDRGRGRAWDRTEAPAARPLFRPAPRSAMVFPLVVLVAVLPGLVALNAWDLTPPGPLWGLRGLAVLDGMVLDQVPAAAAIRPVQEAAAYRAVAFQPPLYAWLEAALFWLDGDRDPMASVLPSYVAGGLAVDPRLPPWPALARGGARPDGRDPGRDSTRTCSCGCRRRRPSTLALCGVLAVLLAYGWHERVIGESMRPLAVGRPGRLAAVGGLAMGLALLALGGLALIVIPIILLHQYYLRAGQPAAACRPAPRPRRWRAWLAWRGHSGPGQRPAGPRRSRWPSPCPGSS